MIIPKNFLAVGWGKFGPYATYTRRTRGRLYFKASIGLRGILAGLKHSGKRFSFQGMINIISGKLSISMKRKGRRRRR
jgi:hypothetical protein